MSAFRFVVLIAACAVNSAATTCANVRCAGPCLDTTDGPKCCELSNDGCSADDYAKDSCIKCADTQYANECFATCDGHDTTSNVCSPCEPESLDCKITGCNGELCVAADSDIDASICVVKCEYKCLRFQSCAMNADGKCAWSVNEGKETEYASCIQSCERNVNIGGGDSQCACPAIYAPICCNGKTYDNPCSAECHGVQRPAQEQTECKMGACEKKRRSSSKACRCTKIFRPLCCHGKTYNNACLAECDGIKPPAHAQVECTRGECARREL
eukprot:CAMPEP_0197027744 /NCGR_PEP_ID=MMETSP1384-20130603/7629_1 /TAXON_ID=29189 /ORGANISM="Ammonia sp." /LENGTH=270 /DNA_ID=CAMNT_0042456643 /DNA_START=32 /DNA_END=844 /DNA_ORIENTATION=+